jgi:hypothetical protein
MYTMRHAILMHEQQQWSVIVIDHSTILRRANIPSLQELPMVIWTDTPIHLILNTQDCRRSYHTLTIQQQQPYTIAQRKQLCKQLQNDFAMTHHFQTDMITITCTSIIVNQTPAAHLLGQYGDIHTTIEVIWVIPPLQDAWKLLQQMGYHVTRSSSLTHIHAIYHFTDRDMLWIDRHHCEVIIYQQQQYTQVATLNVGRQQLLDILATHWIHYKDLAQVWSTIQEQVSTACYEQFLEPIIGRYHAHQQSVRNICFTTMRHSTWLMQQLKQSVADKNHSFVTVISPTQHEHEIIDYITKSVQQQ